MLIFNYFDFETIRSWFELFSYISTTVVAIIGGIALYQLKLASDSLKTAQESVKLLNADIQIRIEREAAVMTIEQVKRFGSEIIPKFGHELDDAEKIKLTLKPWRLLNKTFDHTSFENIAAVDKWIHEVGQHNKMGVFTGILNDNESFAMYFMSGAADEKLAFPAAATVFCSTVERLAPVLVVHRHGTVRSEVHDQFNSGPFQNLIGLYQTWSARLEKNNLESQSAQIIARSEGIHVTDIPILGAIKSKKGVT